MSTQENKVMQLGTAPAAGAMVASSAAPDLSYGIDHYINDARGLRLDEFITVHGRAFLLYHGRLGEAVIAPIPFAKTMAQDAAVGAGATRRVAIEYTVLPIRNTGRSPVTRFVSVGRTPNNDIVIPDASVSKFHAYFVYTADGRVEVRDAGSTNGSFVGDLRADVNTMTAVPPGAQMRIGSIKLTCLYAKEFCELVKRLAL
jgi:hypothetical protein